MLNYIVKDKIKALLCIAYFLFSQLSLIHANHESKVWALIPLVIILGIKKFPIKLFLYLTIIPLTLTASLLFRETINIEGWTFVNIHLGSAVFAFLAVNSESVKNYINSEKLCALVIIFGTSIIILTMAEFIIGIAPGRIIFGSQNLTSLTLTLTIPLAFLCIKNIKIKFLYVILSIITVAVLIKSRGLSVVILLVTLFYIRDDIRNLPRNYKIAILSYLSLFFIAIFLIFNKRFDDLFSGNTLHYRYYAWLRLVETVLEINPILGYGPSNIVIYFNKYQFLYPQIELLAPLDTFYNPHSDLIFFFASGGILLVALYLSVHFFLIFKYLTRSISGEYDKLIQAAFINYLVIILTAQYDINNTTYSTLISFYLFQAFLFKRLVNDKFIVINQYFFKVLLLSILSMALISHKNAFDLTKNYSSLVYGRLFSNQFINDDFENAPHFKISDTLKTYNYLNTAGDRFDDQIFSELIYNSRKYNKYLEPSLHMSLQYFSFKKDQSQLFALYSDILYKLLIEKKIINISMDPKNIQVIMGESLNFVKKINYYELTITKELLKELINSGSSFGNYKIENYNNFVFKINVDDTKEKIYKNIANDFLARIEEFSSPLKM